MSPESDGLRLGDAAASLWAVTGRTSRGTLGWVGAFTVLVLVAQAALPAARGGTPPSSPLASRAARVSGLLPGWTSRDTTLGSAPCRLAPASDETGRIAPTYTAPTTLRPWAEIDLAIARWRSAALARTITEEVGNAKRLACIEAHQQVLYKRRYHRAVVMRFSSKMPAWVKADPSAALRGYTQTIHVPGYKTSLVYVEVAFIDKADPRVAWSLGFFDYGQASLVPLFKRILATAER